MNGIFSFFRLRPHDDGSIERGRMGRLLIDDEGLHHLEDYHGGALRELPAGPLSAETRDRLARMMRSPYIDVRAWDDHLGDSDADQIPEEELGEPMVPEVQMLPGLPPSIFQYSRVGMEGMHIIEAHGDQLLLDGQPLSPEESKTILRNVHVGAAILRYHRPPPKGTPHIPGTPDYLGKAEPAPARPEKLVADTIKKDPMVPRLGNLYALEERHQKDEGRGAVVAIDINDFWRANEVGWREADEAIVAFGEALARAAGGDAYRDGGDGFVAFCDTKQDAYAMLRELTEALKELPAVGGTYHMTISAGVGETLDRARAALSIAKQSKYRGSSEQAEDSVYTAGSDNLIS